MSRSKYQCPEYHVCTSGSNCSASDNTASRVNSSLRFCFISSMALTPKRVAATLRRKLKNRKAACPKAQVTIHSGAHTHDANKVIDPECYSRITTHVVHKKCNISIDTKCPKIAHLLLTAHKNLRIWTDRCTSSQRPHICLQRSGIRPPWHTA